MKYTPMNLMDHFKWKLILFIIPIWIAVLRFYMDSVLMNLMDFLNGKTSKAASYGAIILIWRICWLCLRKRRCEFNMFISRNKYISSIYQSRFCKMKQLQTICVVFGEQIPRLSTWGWTGIPWAICGCLRNGSLLKSVSVMWAVMINVIYQRWIK